MARLSHIDDVEQAQKAQAAKTSVPEEDMTAAEEEAFHGLDEKQSMSAGHKALIVLACIVVVVAMLYIVNSWIHVL